MPLKNSFRVVMHPPVFMVGAYHMPPGLDAPAMPSIIHILASGSGLLLSRKMDLIPWYMAMLSGISLSQLNTVDHATHLCIALKSADIRAGLVIQHEYIGATADLPEIPETSALTTDRNLHSCPDQMQCTPPAAFVVRLFRSIFRGGGHSSNGSSPVGLVVPIFIKRDIIACLVLKAFFTIFTIAYGVSPQPAPAVISKSLGLYKPAISVRMAGICCS